MGIPGIRQFHVSLFFLRNGPDVLLLKGAPTKRIWPNLFNGVGGHVEAGEDVLTAARREVLEETGLEVDELKLAAVVNINAGIPTPGILMFVFTGWTEKRRVKASDEGTLHWLPAGPFDKVDLVEDLKELLPDLLAINDMAPPLFLRYSYDSQDRLLITKSD